MKGARCIVEAPGHRFTGLILREEVSECGRATQCWIVVPDEPIHCQCGESHEFYRVAKEYVTVLVN